MVVSCCVKGCKSRGSKPGVQYFQLPLNKPSVLTQWLIVLDRRDWIPKPSSRICSLHFSPEDYFSRPNQPCARLRADVIPSLFPDVGSEEEDELSSNEKEKEAADDLEKNTSKESNKTPSIPVHTPSLRPRRAPKVSSKMKDYILLDDIKKNQRLYTPSTSGTKEGKEGQKAAQELLSILEDSNSLSGSDESDTEFHINSGLPLNSSQNMMKIRPAPASIKRAKLLAQNQNKSTVGQSSSVPMKYRKTYYQLKVDDKTLFLNYSDLNPSVNMAANNTLFNDKVGKENKLKRSSDLIYLSDSDEDDDFVPSSNDNSTPFRKKTPNTKIKTQKRKNENILSKAMKNVSFASDSKSFSMVKKKKYKTVAEIVVRTDDTGVSIEKLTSLEDNEVPKSKRPTFSNIPIGAVSPLVTNVLPTANSSSPLLGSVPPVQNNILLEDEETISLAKQVIGTIKKMKLLEKMKGNSPKLTVLITTLPPIQENESLLIKRKNKVTNAEKSQELQVVISSHKGTGLSESNSDSVSNSDTISAHVVAISDTNSETNTVVSNVTASERDDGTQEQIINTAGDGQGGDLVHDHTYISPTQKLSGEFEVTGDEQIIEVPVKPKLSDGEIAYRSKVHKKLRLLKEAVKRKNELISRLKDKIQFLEKTLRDERKGVKVKKINATGRSGIFNKTLEVSANSASAGTMDVEENIEESDEDDRDCNSPITYICEPAIDVCEKNEIEESA